MTEIRFPVELFADWWTVDQALAHAKATGRKLEAADLREHCRVEYAPAGLAVFLSQEGPKTGGTPEDYQTGKGGIKGMWLVHRSAVEARLAERAARGYGNPNFKQPGQPGIRRRGKAKLE